MDDLPSEAAEAVWAALDYDRAARKGLYTASRSLRALFASSITGPQFNLQADNRSSIFKGLHPGVQPRRLTVRAPNDEEGNCQDGRLHDFFSAFMSSPHYMSGRLEQLHIQVCCPRCAQQHSTRACACASLMCSEAQTFDMASATHILLACLQGFHLLLGAFAGLSPCLFKNLRVLQLQQVTFQASVLAAALSHCHHLEELDLDHTTARTHLSPWQ
jgi:hypothetical protein